MKHEVATTLGFADKLFICLSNSATKKCTFYGPFDTSEELKIFAKEHKLNLLNS